MREKVRENDSLCEGDQSMKHPPKGAREESKPSLHENEQDQILQRVESWKSGENGSGGYFPT